MSRGPSSPPAGGRKPGSQPALRRQNTQRVLQALAQGGPTTQAKLARSTGLSTGTISNIVKELDTSRRIRTRPVVDSGRRAIEISLSDDRVIVGVAIDTASVRIIATRFDHTIVTEIVHALAAGHRPRDTLRSVRGWLDDSLRAHGLEANDVAAAAVSLPSALDERHQLLTADPTLAHWHDHDLGDLCETIFPFPVTFENDANVQALAQVTWGPYNRNTVLAAVKVGLGVGAGLIVHGQLLRGSHGAAGELGHLPVAPLGPRCHCGNRGCLQTIAGITHILADVRRARRLSHPPSIPQLIDLARHRDPATLRVLDEVGQALGLGLAHLVTLINPHAVVITGPLAPIGAPFLDPIGRALNRHAHPAIGYRTTLSMSQLGDRAEALGAATLAAAAVTAP